MKYHRIFWNLVWKVWTFPIVVCFLIMYYISKYYSLIREESIESLNETLEELQNSEFFMFGMSITINFFIMILYGLLTYNPV